jgi:hypothetical protein
VVRRPVRRLEAATIAVLALAGAAGFSTPALFAEPVSVGGGGGRWFTGSSRDGFGCQVCHDGAVAPLVEVDGVPEAWTAGSTYTLSLRWSVDSGSVAFVGEVVDEIGDGVGALATPPPDVVEDEERCAGGSPAVRLEQGDGGTRTLFAIPACGATRTRVQWTAPDVEDGSVFLHLGVVHGDDSGTPDGDGVRMLAYEIPSAAAIDAAQGCRVGGAPDATAWLPVLVLLPWCRRRLRRRRRA